MHVSLCLYNWISQLSRVVSHLMQFELWIYLLYYYIAKLDDCMFESTHCYIYYLMAQSNQNATISLPSTWQVSEIDVWIFKPENPTWLWKSAVICQGQPWILGWGDSGLLRFCTNKLGNALHSLSYLRKVVSKYFMVVLRCYARNAEETFCFN